MEYLALFFTTSASVKFRRKLNKLDIAVEALPVPRKLSSGCGIAIRFCWPDNPLPLLDDGIEKLYSVEENGYNLIYQADRPSSN
jgi:hypothetical protein